jgi:uncharacterized protein DUF5916
MRHRLLVVWLFLCVDAPMGSSSAAAQSSLAGETIRISHAAGSIAIDGDLSDEGWRGATRVDKWYEVNPGDNTEPKVRNVGYLTYDDRFLYAGFEFEDPDPHAMRAPYADRDNIGNGFNDYGGIIVDAGNSGHTGTFFVVTPRNIQYDAITDDSSGEDSSPDFFWESATKINDHGWTLEIRVPFTSLRYKTGSETWGILLYRNYPRDFHYQFFSAKLPRGGSCFVCRENTLAGLTGLPSGGHLVAAPYVSGSQDAHPRDDLGSPLVNGSLDPHVGLDVKFTPSADNALDLTVNPDFSQVESDVAQISANERFALFFPEKRPFFLEGVDLFQTPMSAVYTRTIAAPDWGGRLTGKERGIRYTVLVTEDAGGGSVIIPGPNESSLATQDFPSTVFIARVKRDIGLSSVGLIVTDREARRGDAPLADAANGHNRVLGPDMQWRPRASEQFSGQLLFSHSQTPNRPDLADEWTGQTLASHAASLGWNHNTTRLDLYGGYKDIGDEFRADSGFLPQVGYREGYGGGGWTFRPNGFVRRLRTFLDLDRQAERDGAVISWRVMPGFGMDTRWNGFMQYRLIDDAVRSGDQVFTRRRFGYVLQFSPSRRVPQVSLNGTTGEETDFANSRPAQGTTLNLSATVDPTQHLDLSLVQNQRWINVDDASGASRRLFLARVSRVRATYTFTARMFVRTIAQYVSTDRNPSLYLSSVADRSATFNGSALLAYKINWQSVMFVGYGDDRELSDEGRFEKLGHQFFVKVSYAFQR